jgi:uncharacterized protein (TIGR03085 family)
MPFHPAERAALVRALTTAGPGAPTLCAGWRSEHLAAHVVLRESTALTALGIVVPALHDRTEAATRSLGDSSADAAGYASLLARVAAGPPRWHPVELLGDPAQLAELFIHTEDVRRGGPDGVAVEPRPLAPDEVDALWLGLRRLRRRMYGKARPAATLSDGTGRTVVAKRAGTGSVTVTGPVGELLLHAYGRSTAAHVTVTGSSPEAVAALHAIRPTPA